MSLMRKLFGGGDPLGPLRRAFRQKAWADVLARAESLDPGCLDPAGREELEKLRSEAGDALAELNLFEGDACLRAGNRERAVEHFALAAAQARSEELLQRISERQGSPVHSAPRPSPSPVSSPAAPAQSSCCPTGCGSGGHGSSSTSEEDLDEAVRLELILTSYPHEWAHRYNRLHGHLRRGFLLAHEGREEEALDAFDLVPIADRDDLYHFERGSLLARTGDEDGARKDLEKALGINPSHLLAHETLIDLDFARGDLDAAEGRLRTLLGRGEAPAFCYGRLAAVEASRGRLEEALSLGLEALSHGSDPQVILLTASLLERAGRTAEAEAILSRFPSGGCGGHNVPLAEFWIRHGKNLDKALAAFQGSLRHEPDSPRWRVRIAQVYFAQGRRREAEHLLTQALTGASLDPDLSREANSILEACRSTTNP